MIPVGIFCCFYNLTDENVFIILYGVTSVYFAGVMVRLMLTLTPVACILAAIGFSHVLDIYAKPAKPAKKCVRVHVACLFASGTRYRQC
jgi:dolichyl-diphosphooligosaccharide--protein glycosyltransferase